MKREYDNGTRINAYAAAVKNKVSINTIKGYQRRNRWPGLDWEPMKSEEPREFSPGKLEPTWLGEEMDRALQIPIRPDDGRFEVNGEVHLTVPALATFLGVSRRTLENMEGTTDYLEGELILTWEKDPKLGKPVKVCPKSKAERLKTRMAEILKGEFIDKNGKVRLSQERFLKEIKVGRKRHHPLTLVHWWRLIGCKYLGGKCVLADRFSFLFRRRRRSRKGYKFRLVSRFWFFKDQALEIKKALFRRGRKQHSDFDGVFPENLEGPKAFSVARAAKQIGLRASDLWKYVHGEAPAAMLPFVKKYFEGGKLPSSTRRIPGKKNAEAEAIIPSDLEKLELALKEACRAGKSAAHLQPASEICEAHGIKWIGDRILVTFFLQNCMSHVTSPRKNRRG